MNPKQKLIRLSGQALRNLVALVYERDQHKCVVCGRWVQDGVKPHHEPCGSGRKSDEFWKMFLLCDECHYKRHHTGEAMSIKDKIIRYRDWMMETFEDLRNEFFNE